MVPSKMPVFALIEQGHQVRYGRLFTIRPAQPHVQGPKTQIPNSPTREARVRSTRGRGLGGELVSCETRREEQLGFSLVRSVIAARLLPRDPGCQKCKCLPLLPTHHSHSNTPDREQIEFRACGLDGADVGQRCPRVSRSCSAMPFPSTSTTYRVHGLEFCSRVGAQRNLNLPVGMSCRRVQSNPP